MSGTNRRRPILDTLTSPPNSTALFDDNDESDADLRAPSDPPHLQLDSTRNRRSSFLSDTPTLNSTYAPSVLSHLSTSTGQLTYAEERTESGQRAQYVSQYGWPFHRVGAQLIPYDRWVESRGQQPAVAEAWERNRSSINLETIHNTNANANDNVADWINNRGNGPPPAAGQIRRHLVASTRTRTEVAHRHPLEQQPREIERSQTERDQDSTRRPSESLRRTLELMAEGSQRSQRQSSLTIASCTRSLGTTTGAHSDEQFKTVSQRTAARYQI